MDVADHAKKSMNKKDLPGSFFPIGNEEQLIKIMLLEFSQEKFSDVVEIITEDDFTNEKNALAFKVIKQLVLLSLSPCDYESTYKSCRIDLNHV